jgi:hypothetical protein
MPHCTGKNFVIAYRYLYKFKITSENILGYLLFRGHGVIDGQKLIKGLCDFL